MQGYRIAVTLEDLVSWAPINNVFSGSYNAWKWIEDANLPSRYVREELHGLSDYARDKGHLEVAGIIDRLASAVKPTNVESVKDLVQETDRLLEQIGVEWLTDLVASTLEIDQTIVRSAAQKLYAQDRWRTMLHEFHVTASEPDVNGNGELLLGPIERLLQEGARFVDGDLRERMLRPGTPILLAARIRERRSPDPWQVPEDLRQRARAISPEFGDAVVGLIGRMKLRDWPALRAAIWEVAHNFDKSLTHQRIHKVGYPYWRGALVQFVKPRMLHDHSGEGAGAGGAGEHDSHEAPDANAASRYERVTRESPGRVMIEGDSWKDWFAARKKSAANRSFFNETDALVLRRKGNAIHAFTREDLEQGVWVNVYPHGERLGHRDLKGRLQRGMPVTEDDLVKGCLPLDGESRLHPLTQPLPGGITFWVDVGSGYQISVRQVAHKIDRKNRFGEVEAFGTHNEYAFDLEDGPYDTDVYLRDADEATWFRARAPYHWEPACKNRCEAAGCGHPPDPNGSRMWRKGELAGGHGGPIADPAPEDIFDEVDDLAVQSTADEAFGHYHGPHLDPPMTPGG